MPSYVTPKKNTAFVFYISLTSQADTKLFQTNPTLAAGDVKVSTDGSALANPTTLPSVDPAGSKLVKISLSASEMNGDNVNLLFSDAAGAEWCDVEINIQTSAQQIDDLMATFTLPTNFSSFAIDANGRVKALVGLTQNVAFTAFQFRMVDSGGDPVTGLVNGDFTTKTYSIAGGAQGSIAGTITEDPGADGFYLVDLLAAELNGRSVSFVFEATGTIQTALTVWPSQ